MVLVYLNLDEAICMKLESWKEDLECRLDSSFLIEEIDAMDETLGSLWKGMPLVGRNALSNDEMDDANVG